MVARRSRHSLHPTPCLTIAEAMAGRVAIGGIEGAAEEKAYSDTVPALYRRHRRQLLIVPLPISDPAILVSRRALSDAVVVVAGQSMPKVRQGRWRWTGVTGDTARPSFVW